MKTTLIFILCVFGVTMFAKYIPEKNISAKQIRLIKIERVVKTIPHKGDKKYKASIKRLVKNVDTNTFEKRDTFKNIQLTYLIDLSK
ncbi:hypothetical protein [Aquimarina agarivorans]|uniref:hypothetical protein n=1 Tax=Aquimarina agarivorans TaxID=980584 RepID=UPI000248E618|nr:hypothetical protein [Aquimarina agarivorans]